jgi:predicted nucleic acid-binding protein
MTREVVLDANVIVAWLDEADVLAARARELMKRLRDEGAELVLVDVAVTEALSVLCRRATQRRTSPPNLFAAIVTIRSWNERGSIRWLAREQQRVFERVLDVVETTAGRLNVNDALLVVLQGDGIIGEVASFDSGFDAVGQFSRVS